MLTTLGDGGNPDKLKMKKEDISILLKSGHFYLGLTNVPVAEFAANCF